MSRQIEFSRTFFVEARLRQSGHSLRVLETSQFNRGRIDSPTQIPENLPNEMDLYHRDSEPRHSKFE
jgi:hypothetical protein